MFFVWVILQAGFALCACLAGKLVLCAPTCCTHASTGPGTNNITYPTQSAPFTTPMCQLQPSGPQVGLHHTRRLAGGEIPRILRRRRALPPRLCAARNRDRRGAGAGGWHRGDLFCGAPFLWRAHFQGAAAVSNRLLCYVVQLCVASTLLSIGETCVAAHISRRCCREWLSDH